MPRVACRDAGINCSWFYEADDTGKAIVDALRHSEEEHPEVMKEMVSKYKTWEIVVSLLRLMKH